MKLKAALGVLAAFTASAGDIPHGYFQARLTTPIASYSRPGTAFQARILGPVSNSGARLLPRGTVIRGHIVAAKSIGVGLRRERARLDLQFDGCQLPDKQKVACEVRLAAVDNAREQVDRTNRIQGILAASHPHSWLGGLWFRPVPALFQKAPFGLTGAGGMIYSKLASPIAAGAIIFGRMALFRLPEPEIELYSGTDLILRIATPADTSGKLSGSDPEFALEQDLINVLQLLPTATVFPDGNAASDIIQFAFLGDRDAVKQAFERAGWSQAEQLTAKTFARTYKAVASMGTYPAAPVSTLMYDGRPPEMVYQKSYNAISKRHHIRLWAVEHQGQTIWVGAATHDISVGFEWNRISFTHRIDPHIDRERSVIVNDLIEAGCLAESTLLERPDQKRTVDNGDPISTDGSLLVAHLVTCSGSADKSRAPSRPKRRLPLLAFRRLTLESRHYATRGNPYYWGIRTIRWGFSSKHRTTPYDEE